MNRRTFLQSVGATAILATTPILAAKEKNTLDPSLGKDDHIQYPMWISFKDKLPTIGDYVDIKDKYGNIESGIVDEFIKGTNRPNEKLLCLTYQNVSTINGRWIEINNGSWMWRYANPWISFKDHMPEDETQFQIICIGTRQIATGESLVFREHPTESERVFITRRVSPCAVDVIDTNKWQWRMYHE